jgi:hypothetical protein
MVTPEPCDPYCPIGACLECAYAGGESGDPWASTRRDISGARWENKSTPGGASTPSFRGPRPSDLTGGLPAMILTPRPLVNIPSGGN